MKKTATTIKKPILTEKSLQDAAEGKFTFEVELKADKKTITKGLKKVLVCKHKEKAMWLRFFLSL